MLLNKAIDKVMYSNRCVMIYVGRQSTKKKLVSNQTHKKGNKLIGWAAGRETQTQRSGVTAAAQLSVVF